MKLRCWLHRLGWGTSRGDLSGPVGFDQHSFGYRDVDGMMRRNLNYDLLIYLSFSRVFFCINWSTWLATIFLGSKVHDRCRIPYGDSYKAGDVLGFYISLPHNGSNVCGSLSPAKKTTPLNSEVILSRGAGALTKKKKMKLKRLPDSEIRVYKNGIAQGVMFTEIFEGTYFPAASLYEKAVVTFNPGPDFQFPPNDVTFKPYSDLVLTSNVMNKITQ